MGDTTNVGDGTALREIVISTAPESGRYGGGAGGTSVGRTIADILPVRMRGPKMAVGESHYMGQNNGWKREKIQLTVASDQQRFSCTSTTAPGHPQMVMAGYLPVHHMP